MAVAALLLAASGCVPTHANVVFDGQSYNLAPSPEVSYPAQVMASSDDTWSVVALADTSWTVLATTADERTRPSGGFDVLVMSGGFTDLAREYDTAEQVLADELAYAKAARARGFDAVIVLTIPPSTVLYDRLGQEAQRVEHNRLLLVESTGFDAVVNIEVPCIDDPLSGCYFDGTHYTELGAGIVAELVAPVVEAIIP